MRQQPSCARDETGGAPNDYAWKRQTSPPAAAKDRLQFFLHTDQRRCSAVWAGFPGHTAAAAHEHSLAGRKVSGSLRCRLHLTRVWYSLKMKQKPAIGKVRLVVQSVSLGVLMVLSVVWLVAHADTLATSATQRSKAPSASAATKYRRRLHSSSEAAELLKQRILDAVAADNLDNAQALRTLQQKHVDEDAAFGGRSLLQVKQHRT